MKSIFDESWAGGPNQAKKECCGINTNILVTGIQKAMQVEQIIMWNGQ